MNRITACFANAKQQNRKVLIPYISSGDPQPQLTVAIMHALVAGGADIIELGIAFSDPAADGETIQKANERALAKGVKFDDVLNAIADFRTQDKNTPIVLMGYLNSFERGGAKNRLQAAANAGADGVILVDCPIEALADYKDALDSANLCNILLVAPTTKEPRRQQIIDAGAGFLYFVSLRGVTGNQKACASDIQECVSALTTKSKVPVCVGFGIDNAQLARQIAAFCDGVIIGSALVNTLQRAFVQNEDVAHAAKHFIANIRHALDEGE